VTKLLARSRVLEKLLVAKLVHKIPLSFMKLGEPNTMLTVYHHILF
jgi:hypothetical protein